MNILDIDEQNENQIGMVSDSQEFDLLQNNERKKYIQLALSKLNREDHLIISLHYIGEKSVAEICEILDVKKSAIKMRLLRGRRLLQNELERILKTESRNLL